MCKGYKVGSEEVEVSLLQFVDGTLFFEEVSSHDILVVKSILRNFELMSELKVNYHKSKVVGILVDHRRTQGLADILDCKTMNIPFIYLRILVGANLKKEATWESVINKMKRRWRLMNDDGSFWYSVVKEKYANSHSEWSVQRAATVSGWCRSLWSCAEEEDWFEGRVNSISDMGTWVDGGWVWRFNWQRVLFDWEVQLLEELRNAVGSFKSTVVEEDRWVWAASEDGGFSVALAYKYLQDQGMVEVVNVADKERLIEVIKLKSWIWLRGKLKGFSYSFYEWSTNPKVCLEGAG
ncbi:uncharacterized protein LOC130736036 [Lotus japonicus]|uniref:uncharacterized protein LOC130736036 n=1 Tax=Lotus japonicus TaxID=34305 RepID=UPI00258CE9B6|nr:uncharacterized protein LOC130736036 [Lotus japonicus]